MSEEELLFKIKGLELQNEQLKKKIENREDLFRDLIRAIVPLSLSRQKTTQKQWAALCRVTGQFKYKRYIDKVMEGK